MEQLPGHPASVKSAQDESRFSQRTQFSVEPPTLMSKHNHTKFFDGLGNEYG